MIYTPYQTGSETSKEAAAEIKEVATNLKQQVLAHMIKCGKDGTTDEEVQNALQMNPSTQRPRRIDLTNEGFVVDSGVKRLTSSNRKAVVWLAVQHAPENANIKMTLEQKLVHLGFPSLDEYYECEHWPIFKASYYSRHSKVCFITERTENIQLHHITYERLGAELDEDVVPLCKFWHKFVHHLVKERKVKLSEAHLVAKESYLACKFFLER